VKTENKPQGMEEHCVSATLQVGNGEDMGMMFHIERKMYSHSMLLSLTQCSIDASRAKRFPMGVLDMTTSTMASMLAR